MAERKPPQNPQANSRDQVTRIQRKMEALMQGGFDRIDAALQETGVVSSMQELFAQRGLDEFYWTFDSLGYSIGMPFPVRARYVMPVVDQDIDWSSKKPYPGIVAYEIITPGQRTLDIQFGISQKEIEHLLSRGRAVTHKDPEWSKKHPLWWSSSRTAYDMTREYDLYDMDDSEGRRMEALAVNDGEKSKNAFWDVYVWGYAMGVAGIITATFEQENERYTRPRQEWNSHNEDVQQGIQNLDKMIEERLRAASPR